LYAGPVIAPDYPDIKRPLMKSTPKHFPPDPERPRRQFPGDTYRLVAECLLLLPEWLPDRPTTYCPTGKDCLSLRCARHIPTGLQSAIDTLRHPVLIATPQK